MLKGKNIVVTGGLGGIGLEMTQILLRERANVFPTTRSVQQAESLNSKIASEFVDNCHPMTLSLETDESIDAFIERLDECLDDKVYGLVNTAVCRSSVDDACCVDRAVWAEHYGINVFANARLTKLVAERLMQDGGAIVNISSFYSENVPDNRVYDEDTVPTSLIYASSKAAQNYITRYMAVRYAPRGIRVNSILAGGVRNPERQSDSFVEKYSYRTPMGRMANLDEFNDALLMLLSPKNSFCTGQLIAIDGGWGLL